MDVHNKTTAQPGDQDTGAPQMEFWAIVELMGHQKIAGYLTTINTGASVFFMVDVPEIGLAQAFTRIFNPAAVYAINPVDEQTARIVANSLKAKPVAEWSIDRAIQVALSKQATELEPGEDDPTDPARDPWAKGEGWDDD